MKFSFESLRITHKLAAVGLILAAMIAAPTSLYLREMNKQIEFSSLELAGVEPSQEISAVLMALLKHRGASTAVLTGDSSAQAIQSTAANEITRLLEAYAKKAEGQRALVDEALGLKSSFEGLRREVEGRSIDAKASFEKHSALIDLTVVAIQNAADAYNMSLDPDVDSYYLMSSAVFNLPPLIAALGEIRAIGASVLQSGEMNKEQLGRLHAKRGVVMGSIQAIDTSLAKVVSVNAALEPKLKALRTQLTDAAQRSTSALESGILNVDRLSLSPKVYFESQTQSLESFGGVGSILLKEFASVVHQRVDRMQSEKQWVLGGLSALVLIAFAVAIAVIHSLVRRTQVAAEFSSAVAKGDLNFEVKRPGHDEIGKVLQSLSSMQAQLRERIERDRAVAAVNERIRQALDSASANMMLIDQAHTITFVNEGFRKLATQHKDELSRVWPKFNLTSLQTSRFEEVIELSELSAQDIDRLTAARVVSFAFGSLHFELHVSPVFDAAGTRVGTVLDWTDRTIETRTATEISKLVKAATQGRFDTNLSTEGMTGFYLTLGEGLNELMRTVNRGIEDVSRVVKALAAGDLTQRIDEDYQGALGELKVNVNASVTQMSEVVGEIKRATDSIGTAAREIAAGNLDLSRRTEQAASSLEETASSMEELTGTVKQSADNARQANQLSKGAAEVAVSGGQVVEQVVTTMGSISESSRKIGDIISVIDGIAFQTNILALNAAVEAARAGEQGRGFAVVAGEVRSLAQRSASAAKEIKALISESVERVDQGQRLVESAGQTMSDVVTSIKRVTDIMGELSAAAVEQSAGIEQVNGAVIKMDQVTQQNAALVEESAAAAESLLAQAQRLAEAVSRFSRESSTFSPDPSRQGGSRPIGASQREPLRASAAPGATRVADAPNPAAQLRSHRSRGYRATPVDAESGPPRDLRKAANQSREAAGVGMPDDEWQEF